MKRLLFIFAILQIFTLFSASCTSEKAGGMIPETSAEADTNENAETEEISEMIQLDGYTVVCGEKSAEAELEAAKKLYLALSGQAEQIGLSDDFDGKADNSQRPEILVGHTNRPETAEMLAECGEYDCVIRWVGNKLVIVSHRPDYTADLVDEFIEIHLKNGSTDPSLSLISTRKNKSEVLTMRFERPAEDIVYPESRNTAGSENLGEIRILYDDPHTGGPQFIAKLYTELLSRCPSGAEFADASAKIADRGCTPSLLCELASDVISSDEFAAYGFTDREECFVIYRAVLSRDPDEEEIAAYRGNPLDLTEKLTASDEFTGIMDDIIRGPYFWRGTNEKMYASSDVWFASQVQGLLSANTITELPQGALIIMNQQITVPKGATLKTEGDPGHYIRMARLLRTKEYGTDSHIVWLEDGAKVEGIFTDGNMSAFNLDETAGGSNVVILGSGCDVVSCRVSDSVSHQNIWSQTDTSGLYIAHNLITGYASNHDKTWQDGISCLSTDSLIEYNDVIDVTDGGIVAFRYIENRPDFEYTVAQNSIIRYNKILNAGNSCYASHDYETVNYSGPSAWKQQYPANMSGLVSYENEIWTSWRAHAHLVVTFSTLPWQGDVCDRAFGMSFYNNSTPEGCFAMCACGICADKVDDAAIRGNDFTFYVGDWCRSDPRLASRAYSVNSKNTTGDFQPGYSDMAMATESAVFIVNLPGGLELESADEVVVRGTRIHEDKVTIPKERFISQ